MPNTGIGIEGKDEYKLTNLKETELCLGLPGGGVGGTAVDGETIKNSGKRGYMEIIDLKLNLLSKESSEIDHNQKLKINNNSSPLKEKNLLEHSCTTNNDPAKPSASNTYRAQVVGWPPVQSYRKNLLSVQKNGGGADEEKVKKTAALVKVSMAGAPYLRKVDLKMYKSYQDLSDALGKMFGSFTIGKYGTNGIKDFMNEKKLMDVLSGSEYLPTYEDKDGDWMLVGDVPWQMFVDSCKRLRIMKGSDAIGLAPRAVEKCKSRS